MTPRRLILFGIAVLAASSLPLRAQEAAAQPLNAASLAAAIGRDLKSRYNLEGDFDVQLLRPWVAPASAGTDWSVAVVDYPSAPASTMLVRCQVRSGTDVQDSQLVIHAALWRDAWVVKLPLTIGLVFDPSRLDLRRSDMLRDHDVVPATAVDRNFIFARAVPVGRMLTWHDLARHPLVHKGDLVQVTASDGLLVVSLKGIAMENGAQGDTVTIRNPDSRKEFPALVTDENHVQVQF